MGEKKGFLTGHAKSSAAVISLSAHIILIVLAVSFVVVKTYVKDDQVFEAKQIERPRMILKKLPVQITKKRVQKPKLRKTIVAQKVVNVPNISMPEITGIKGGMGYLGDGAGDGIGFDLDLGPEIEFFGVRGGGEGKMHIVFIIDYSQSMSGEKEEIMRREVARAISDLPIGTPFGVIFFAGPAWPPGSNYPFDFSNWVKSGGAHSFRPKDWNNDMPSVRYRRAGKGTSANMVKFVEGTPLVWGTVYDCPIYMALRMNPIPDMIFFMTDGRCAQARGIDSLREMVKQLKAAGKKVPVMHTVGFGISSDSQLIQMAQLTGGESNFLTTEDYIKKYGPGESKPAAIEKGMGINIRVIEEVSEDRYPVEFSLD